MEHRLKVIVRTPNCKIEHCTCGTVHMSVGGTTVRFSTAIGRELRDGMVRAIAEIDKPLTTAPVPGVVLVPPPDDDDDEGPQVH